jgi:hypothetical protein
MFVVHFLGRKTSSALGDLTFIKEYSSQTPNRLLLVSNITYQKITNPLNLLQILPLLIHKLAIQNSGLVFPCNLPLKQRIVRHQVNVQLLLLVLHLHRFVFVPETDPVDQRAVVEIGFILQGKQTIEQGLFLVSRKQFSFVVVLDFSGLSEEIVTIGNAF